MRVRDLMQSPVETVKPDTSLVEMEHKAIASGMSGFPVVDGDILVGVISRSDVVRARNVERSVEGQMSDFYASSSQDTAEDVSARGARIGARIEGKKVSDVMSHKVIHTAPDESVAAAARTMIDKGIHRLPVTENGHLVGIVTSLDIARAVAEGKLTAK